MNHIKTNNDDYITHDSTNLPWVESPFFYDILEKYNLDGEQINELRKYKPEVKYELDSYIFGLDQILDEKKL